jgi:hypothetical protein
MTTATPVVAEVDGKRYTLTLREPGTLFDAWVAADENGKRHYFDVSFVHNREFSRVSSAYGIFACWRSFSSGEWEVDCDSSAGCLALAVVRAAASGGAQ